MHHDVKATGLKSLQGKIWKAGYRSKELQGHVYDDVVPLLQWCQSHDISVNIYSSGSIAAQKLLFGSTTHGDLCPFITNHFDTTSGGKKEMGSYQEIAKALKVDVNEIVFVSDAELELKAAREAGIGGVVMSVRPGNEPLIVEEESGEYMEFVRVWSLLQLCGTGM